MPEIQGPNDRVGSAIGGGTKLLKRAFKLLNEAKRERQPIAQHWENYYRMWATDQWHDKHTQDWQSTPQANFIFSTIELKVSTLTDQDPQVVVFPRHDDDQSAEVAEVLTKIFDNSWRKARGRLALKNIVRNKEIYGTGIAKAGWDSEKEEVSIFSVPPDQFFPDPSALTDDDMWYCFHVYEVSMNDIIANWPEKARQVKPGKLKDLGAFDRDVWSSTEAENLLGGTGRLTFTEGASTHTTIVDLDKGERVPVADGRVTLIEFWEKDPRSGDITLHYIADNKVLQTVEDPLGKRLKRFPFIRFPNIPVDGQFWSLSTIQALEPLQRSINERRRQIIDNMRILGNPPILADKSAGLEEDIILGAPGEIISINDGSRVSWLQPPAMPQGIFQLQQMDKSDMETVSGMFDVVQGRTPTGIEAAAAIAELQEAAQIRVRDSVALMEDSMEQLGQVLLDLIQSNYTERKALMLLGKEDALERVEINVPQNMVEAQQVLEVELDKSLDLEQVSRALDVTKGDFFIQIKAGSTLPISKAAKLNEAMLLYDRGLVDQQEVLQAIQHPRRQEIIQRMTQPQQAELGALLEGAQEDAGVGPGSVAPAEELPPEGLF